MEKKLNNINELHDKAMNLYDESLRIQNKDAEKGGKLLREAFELEREAAAQISGLEDMEPSRSILMRSAATLGLRCGELRESEKLIGIALAGNPPEEIAQELRDLFEQVNFGRHLETQGTILSPNEFQFSMAGPAINYGMANLTHFIERVKGVERAIHRTAERLLKVPFREKGRPKKELSEKVDVFIAVPQANSFAVKFLIGTNKQESLPLLNIGENTINEFMDCVELLIEADEDKLKKRIPEEEYYRNFVGLLKTISPDGENVRVIGFTSHKEGKDRKLALIQSRKPTSSKRKGPRVREQIKVQGILKAADKLQDLDTHIQIVDDNNNAYKISVPVGMMNDIVKPMWDCEVLITGIRKGKIILLEDIEKVI